MLWIPVVIVAAAALFLIVVFVAANKIFDVAVNAKKTKKKVLETNANKSADGAGREKRKRNAPTNGCAGRNLRYTASVRGMGFSLSRGSWLRKNPRTCGPYASMGFRETA